MSNIEEDVNDNIDSSTIEGADNGAVNDTQQVQEDNGQKGTGDQQQNDSATNKRDANSRIRQLIAEKNELKRQINNSALLTNTQIPDEISPDEYQAMMVNSTQTALEVQQLKTENAYRDLKSDGALVAATIPELNPESPAYNKDLEDLLSKQYEENYIISDAQGRFVGTKKSLAEFMTENVSAMRRIMTKSQNNIINDNNRVNDEDVVSSSISTKDNNDEPDFESMTSKQMIEYLKKRK